jgi:hypothetical protein
MTATHKVTFVVCLPSVITQETHRISLCNVLGVIANELLDAIP